MMTKTKTFSVNLGSSPSRGSFIRNDDGSNVGPGQYDDRKQFGQDTKSFRIGEKRAERVQESLGPGAYEPDRADNQTKTRLANINMGTSQSRADIIRKDDNVGPGQYEDIRRFGSETKSFRIGEKRAERV